MFQLKLFPVFLATVCYVAISFFKYKNKNQNNSIIFLIAIGLALSSFYYLNIEVSRLLFPHQLVYAVLISIINWLVFSLVNDLKHLHLKTKNAQEVSRSLLFEAIIYLSFFLIFWFLS
jgi:hypothetical protein